MCAESCCAAALPRQSRPVLRLQRFPLSSRNSLCVEYQVSGCHRLNPVFIDSRVFRAHCMEYHSVRTVWNIIAGPLFISMWSHWSITSPAVLARQSSMFSLVDLSITSPAYHCRSSPLVDLSITSPAYHCRSSTVFFVYSGSMEYYLGGVSST